MIEATIQSQLTRRSVIRIKPNSGPLGLFDNPKLKRMQNAVLGKNSDSVMARLKNKLLERAEKPEQNITNTLTPIEMAQLLAIDPAQGRTDRNLGLLSAAAFALAVELRAIDPTTFILQPNPALMLSFHNLLTLINSSIPLSFLRYPMSPKGTLGTWSEDASVLASAVSASGITKFGFNRIASNPLKDVQDLLKIQIQEGKARFKMKPGFTALFSGSGDMIAEKVQADLESDDAIQISKVPLGLNVWQLLKDYDEETAFAMFDRIGFKDAGEVMLFPLVYQDMFLPHPEKGIDMSIKEIKTIVSLVDKYCIARGCSKKPIYIAGSKKVNGTHKDSANPEHLIVETIGDAVIELNKGREVQGFPGIVVVDPDEIVMKKITEIANGDVIDFVSDLPGYDRYQSQFRNYLDNGFIDPETGETIIYNPTSNNRKKVTYYIHDRESKNIPTIAVKDELVVVLSSEYKRLAVERGVPANQIITVEDLVTEKLEQLTRKKA